MRNPFRRGAAFMQEMQAFEERGADPSVPFGDTTPPPPGMVGSGPLASVLINDTTALQVITVKACVSILADAVATLPMYAYTVDGDGISRRMQQTPQLLEQPYAELSRQDWLTQMMVSLLMRGNAFGYVHDRDRYGNATDIQPVHPDAVSVYRDDAGLKQYRVGGVSVPYGRIMHILGLSAPGAIQGMNPIADARSSIALAKSTEAYGGQFFENSAQASGVIQVDGALSPEATTALAQSWNSAHQGVSKAHLPAVLTEGAKWTSISINPDDAQFLQTRDFQRHDIAMLFRIPEHMLGIQDRTSSWGTGIEQMMIGFVIDTLRPWLTRIETAMTAQLPAVADRISFDLSGRLRGDTEQRFNAYQVAINNGWMCPDEVRDKEDMPPLPGGLGQIFRQSVQSAPATATAPTEPTTPVTEPPDGPS